MLAFGKWVSFVVLRVLMSPITVPESKLWAEGWVAQNANSQQGKEGGINHEQKRTSKNFSF
jgi:hypothetical protein